MTDPIGLFPRARAALNRRAIALLMASPWARSRLAASYAAPVGGRVLDPELGVLLRLNEFLGGPDVADITPARARELLIENALSVELPPPPGVRAQDRTLPGPVGPLGVRIYTPEGLASPSPAVLYIHGGGWVTCDLRTHDSFCRRLALGARCRVVAVDYRLAPEHAFPAAVEDSHAAFRWVAEHAKELSIDPDRIAVAGDSAGGNLSAVLSLRTRAEPSRPALQVLIYPAVDATCSSPSHETYRTSYFLTRRSIDWYLGHYARPEHHRHPDLSPLWVTDVSGAPPALIYTAGFDPLRDEGKAYAERLEKVNVPVLYREYDALVHGFALMGGAVSAARRAQQEIIDDVREHLARPAAR